MKGLILLDIFSYSCMNCLRSLEFIKKIDKKYGKFGLKTVIIHPPEWEFEKNKENMLFAFKKHGVKFPVLIDRNKKFIRKLNMDFWPTQVLMTNGRILYKHVGEGNYKKLEDKIMQILEIKSKKIFNKEPKYSKYPAIYLGKRKKGKLTGFKNRLKAGFIYKGGKWIQKDEFLQSRENDCFLTLLTRGNLISFVAKSTNNKKLKVKIRLGNNFIRNMTVNKPRLYNIIRLKDNKPRKLELTTKPNLAVYSFSFQ